MDGSTCETLHEVSRRKTVRLPKPTAFLFPPKIYPQGAYMYKDAVFSEAFLGSSTFFTALLIRGGPRIPRELQIRGAQARLNPVIPTRGSASHSHSENRRGRKASQKARSCEINQVCKNSPEVVR